jgi:hypothetical protein
MEGVKVKSAYFIVVLELATTHVGVAFFYSLQQCLSFFKRG